MIKLSPENLGKSQLYIQQLLSFLNNFTWILDAYVSDFYFKNHWDRLPKSWCSVLSELTTQELSFLLDRQPVHLRKVLPLSLLSFKTCCDTYSLDRQCQDDIVSKLKSLFSECPQRTAGSGSENESEGNEVKFHPLDESGKLHAFFKKHVKPKKQHEIKNLGQVIYLLSKHIKCDNVVDVGSGLGHLARLLSFGYNLNVTSVEAAGTHAPKATKYDREIDREIKKKTQAAEGKDSVCNKISLPCHVTSMIYPNMTTDEFIAIITSQQQDNEDSKTSPLHFDSSSTDIAKDEANKYRPHSHQSKEIENGSVTMKEFAEPVGDNLTNCSQPLSGGLNKLLTEKNKRMSSVDGKGKEMKYAKLELSSDCASVDPSMLQEDIGCLSHSEKCSEARVASDSEVTKSGHSSETVTSCDMNEQTDGKCHTCQTADLSDEGRQCKLENSGQLIDSANWQFVLTGLHACGDLTPTFLRFFVNCDAAVGLASVGCCYMKISDESCDTEAVGYPMSRFCYSLPQHQLSYASRELACHFADTYSCRLKECPPLLKIHSYRAALEWIANKLCPDFKRTGVQIPTKKINNFQFERYARLGLQKLNIPLEQLSDDLLLQADRMTERWKDVVAFYTIRLALAPVVETLVLLDRLMFLYEKGYVSALLPVFDPGLSPRNFVLLSWKDGPS